MNVFLAITTAYGDQPLKNSVLSFLQKSGTILLTRQEQKACLAWAGNLNREPGVGCAGASSDCAPHALHTRTTVITLPELAHSRSFKPSAKGERVLVTADNRRLNCSTVSNRIFLQNSIQACNASLFSCTRKCLQYLLLGEISSSLDGYCLKLTAFLCRKLLRNK